MCSHRRAESLFIESINAKCPFNSFPCTSPEDLHSGKCLHDVGEVGRMGFHADKAFGRGVQMLETFDKAPYCSKCSCTVSLYLCVCVREKHYQVILIDLRYTMKGNYLI